MSSSSDDLKVYAKRVFDAVSHGSFDEIKKISADFAERFKPLSTMDLTYLLTLTDWSDCMKQKYDESARGHEKITAMEDCLRQSHRESSGNPPAQETCPIQHLAELLSDFKNEIIHSRRPSYSP